MVSSCLNLEEEMMGRVIPIGDKETYTVEDTAIFYVMTGDTAKVQVQFNLDTEADTIIGTNVQLLFTQTEEAEEFYSSYASDADINDINFNSNYLSYSTSNYNGLRTSEVTSILKGKYVITSSKSSGTTTKEAHEFSEQAFSEPADGMYVLLSRPYDGKSNLFWNGCSSKPQSAETDTRSDRTPWRLIKAQSQERRLSGRWYIQLDDGRYLRRSGDRLAPLALTTCNSIEQATAWNMQQVIEQFNLWTLHTDITTSSDFYGITCGKNNALSLVVSGLDTYSLLSSPVALHFQSKDSITYTLPSAWGTFVSLPDAEEAGISSNESSFIGWNTVENQVEGYLIPGTIVEADNATYHAVFVKTE